jgi:hypothetical protein
MTRRAAQPVASLLSVVLTVSPHAQGSHVVTVGGMTYVVRGGYSTARRAEEDEALRRDEHGDRWTEKGKGEHGGAD